MARADKSRVEESEKLEGIERPFGRLMAYVFRHYPVRISLTVVCIITAAVASAVGSIFMQQIVDNVVDPGPGERLRRRARHARAPRRHDGHHLCRRRDR